MDQLWLAAPGLAIKVWAEGGTLRWRLNPAAVEWSLDRNHTDAGWLAVAGQVHAGLLAATPRGRSGLGNDMLCWTVVPLEAGCVAWLTPKRAASAPSSTGWGELADKMELLQNFGRMGLFERNVRSGEGRWDKHMFRLMGLEPALHAPLFSVALERVHADDRGRFATEHQRFIRTLGRHDTRFRVVLPDGGVRELHSLCEVLGGTDGKPASMIGVMIDDTEASARVRAQHALNSKLVEALVLSDISVWRIELGKRRIQYVGMPPAPDAEQNQAEGFSLDEAMALAHPDDLEALLRSDAAAMEQAGVVDVECRFRSADGSYRHLLTRRVAERDAQGNVVALTGVSLDQTAQILEREHARALARSIELVAQATGVGIWSVDVAAGTEEWNAQMFRIYGMPEGQPAPPAQRWISELVHPQDRDRVLELWESAKETEAPGFETEFRLVRPDGSERWVDVRVVNALQDGRTMTHGILLDVTERRAMQAELKREQDRLALATRAAGLGIWERELDGHILYWNDQMYRQRGLEPGPSNPDLATGRTGMTDAVVEMIGTKARRHRELGEPYELEIPVFHADGSQHWLMSVGTAVRDEQGKALRMTGVTWDITERKLAESAVRDKEAAERASQAKSEFLARMSHELRTPLNAILGFAQLIEYDGTGELGAVQLQRVAHIRAAGTHLLSLIDDVLDLSSIEAGSLVVQAEPVSLQLVLDEVGEWLHPMASNAGVTLHLESAAGWVAADPRRIRQVLANLLTNAVKYNRPGGQVWVTVQEVPATAEPGSARALEVRVRDNGRGLTVAQCEHLFEPFNRLGAEQGGIQGAGIGLVVVRHLVGLMGGRIDVQSQPEVGTEFRLSFVAVAPPEQPAPPPATEIDQGMLPPSTGATPRPLTLLYIEDNEVNVMLVRELVATRPNVCFRSAVDGLSGVAQALAELPDVVLIDMQLPDIDGFEVLRRLQAAATLRGTALIALSANAMPEDVARARRAGFVDYWTKPIDFKRFLAGIDALAAGRA